MNLRDLKYFVAVAELKHFGRAAQACFVSQPTLSTQIKKLEEELGVQLFEREVRNVLLTAAGEQALSYARRILLEVDALKAYAKTCQDPYQEPLSIGILPTITPYLLPVIMPQLMKSQSELRLELKELKTEDCLQQLLTGKIDAALLSPPVDMTHLSGEFLISEEFALLVSEQHKFADANYIQMKQLDSQKLLLLDEGHCLRDQALAACQNAGVEGENSFRGTSLETIAHMVNMGMGLSLVPMLSEPHFSQLGLRVKKIKDAPKRELALLWRAGSSRIVVLQAVAAIIRSACKDLSGIVLITGPMESSD